MARDNRRADRVAAAIREEVASLLAGGVKDPRVTGLITVTGVDVTPDLRYATVHVSIMGTDDDGRVTLEGLNAVSYQLKGPIGRALRLRLAPEISFKKDDTAARAARIESLLAQIHSNTPPASDDEERADGRSERDG